MWYRSFVRSLLAVASLALVACNGAPIDDAMNDLARAPESTLCGWTMSGTEQLPELPAGKCWRITPTADVRATGRAGELDACDVKSEPRTYEGGAFVDQWETTLDNRDADYRTVSVDCP
jgi:hypothetical protein